MDKAAHPAKANRFGDIAGAAEVDVERDAKRLLHAWPDQAGGVYDGLDAVSLDRLDQTRQVAHVLAGEPVTLFAELSPQEVGVSPRPSAYCAKAVPINPAPVTRVVMGCLISAIYGLMAWAIFAVYRNDAR
jgi:hypothetical protein